MDHFIKTLSGAYFQTHNVDINYVSDLFLHHSKSWDASKIGEVFIASDDQAIQSIPLPQRSIRDRLDWPFEKKIEYLVRSGYHWVLNQYRYGGATLYGNNLRWRRLWALNITPKIKIFFQSLLNDTLPYKQNLNIRGIQTYLICSRCDEAVEDDLHMSRPKIGGMISAV